MHRLGIVVIGRNEGERLRRCLDALLRMCAPSLQLHIVYVDSGSTDGSQALALQHGADVVALDMTQPFTAARARNAGLCHLMKNACEVEFVQFIDGDCELIDGWLSAAAEFLGAWAEVACVCGRLRERHPERSVYNRLCDFEWDRAAGDTEACGGIAMMRVDVLRNLGGFRDDMVAGEEPELCQRIRRHGWKVWRLPQDMAWHDAAMTRFQQWWKRTTRTGFGNAQRLWLLRAAAERSLASQVLRAWLWAALVPLAVVAAVCAAGLPGLLLLAVYPLQTLRMASRMGRTWSLALERAFFMMLGKFPELIGHLMFLAAGRTPSRSPRFDYKQS